MKLTKADIDKVRHIEGFPIAKDEDIIALSRPPYYTACPNPFIEDFIRENGTPYDEAADDYHREPFAADVSEGKNDPIYNAHSYHTKVPYKAIMRYILHYTKPGDIVFDGFCGTGMTGVAAQMCGSSSQELRMQMTHLVGEDTTVWGCRKAILSDLSPVASFIAHNYNASYDIDSFVDEATNLCHQCKKEFGWMFETPHVDEKGSPFMGIEGKPIMGEINYIVWSDILVCPSCSSEMVFWDVAVDAEHGKVNDVFECPVCHSRITKKDCERSYETKWDDVLGTAITIAKQAPVQVNYTYGKRRYEKRPDKFDLTRLERIENTPIPYWVPSDRMIEGGETRRNDRFGITHMHHFFTRANLIVLSYIAAHAHNNQVLCIITDILPRASKMHKIAVSRLNTNLSKTAGVLSGTLYIPSNSIAYSALYMIESRIADVSNAMRQISDHSPVLVTNQSVTDMRNMPSDCIDYIFTDPPFGSNLNYSELNSLSEGWLRIMTNIRSEAIINKDQKKSFSDYSKLMSEAFLQFYRILKPGRWITVEFHNSQNAVWNAIQDALQQAGFVVADIRTLDKKQTSFKQANLQNAVKQDLVISAYKPKESFVREFQHHAGDPEMVWKFVRQHLSNVPVVADGNRDGKLDIIAERQDYLLFDRMVAYHIMNGIPVPMDAHTFYDGLRQRFLQRDGMFFLPDQVNEYDEKRAHMELDTQQLSFVVTDEKNAIAWLNYILGDGAKTYQEIQPLYLQELHQSKQEKMPELLDMLRENFVQDDKGAWYVPDLSNAADLAKVRRKALLKEFYDSCVPGKGKLKVFRMEAIRAGFDECWKTRDFKTIVAVGERLPESVLQEDPALLMYYDNACSRV